MTVGFAGSVPTHGLRTPVTGGRSTTWSMPGAESAGGGATSVIRGPVMQAPDPSWWQRLETASVSSRSMGGIVGARSSRTMRATYVVSAPVREIPTV